MRAALLSTAQRGTTWSLLARRLWAAPAGQQRVRQSLGAVQLHRTPGTSSSTPGGAAARALHAARPAAAKVCEVCVFCGQLLHKTAAPHAAERKRERVIGSGAACRRAAAMAGGEVPGACVYQEPELITTSAAVDSGSAPCRRRALFLPRGCRRSRAPAHPAPVPLSLWRWAATRCSSEASR